MKNILHKNLNTRYTIHDTARGLPAQAGFTLVETLIALIIFSSSIVGMIVILGGGISNTTFVKSKMTAIYLSQEGIELTRNLRDSYILSMNAMGWTKFTTLLNNNNNNCSAGCSISNDLSSTTYGILVASSQGVLNYDTSTGFYDYSNTNNPSLYTRTITVTPMGSTGDELNIKSTVNWDYQGKSYKVESSENLFNWQ